MISHQVRDLHAACKKSYDRYRKLTKMRICKNLLLTSDMQRNATTILSPLNECLLILDLTKHIHGVTSGTSLSLHHIISYRTAQSA